MENNKKERRCEKCGSYYTYRTLNELVCRKCAHRKKIGRKKNE